MHLFDSVKTLRGIGEATAKNLVKSGIVTVADLLGYLPASYRDLSEQVRLCNLILGETVVVRGTVLTSSGVVWRGSMNMFNITFADETGEISVMYFNQPYSVNKFKTGSKHTLTGKVTEFNGRYQLVNPFVYPYEASEIIPLYIKIPGLGVATHKRAGEHALTCDIPADYSREFLDECGIYDLQSAYKAVHAPTCERDCEEGQKSLVFRRILEFVSMLEVMTPPQGAHPLKRGFGFYEEFVSLLPFEPTDSQKVVMHEIADDVAKDRPMNRLLQGDVGSGKTLPATYALWLASKSGLLSLMMAPTEILAEQHYVFVKSVFGDSCALLTGSTGVKERREIADAVKNKRVRVIVGTHALLFSDMDFSDLSLIVTDEQHRFGVAQRAALMQGNMGVHTLIMSATPIPRTLSLILYDKTSVSLIKNPPTGRKPIKTRIVGESKRKDMYNFIAGRIELGEQVYVVCPLIEHNPDFDARSVEEVFEEISPIIPNARILHGRMKAAEKQEIMREFKLGNIPLIVSTTVIEVGVDVPNACVMIIESAHRFGLAQLHQLRGRVGRGDKESYCFLVAPNTKNERLQILRHSNDGFFIAEKDLELRGAGEFLGRAQHGKGETLELMHNIDLLKHARAVLEKDGFADDTRMLRQIAIKKITDAELVLN